jgi:PAS domain S-box-containing protein
MNTRPITQASGFSPAVLLPFPSSEPIAEPGRDVATVAACSGGRLVITVASDPEARQTGDGDFNALLKDVLARLEKSATCQLGRDVEAIFHRICELPEIERAGLWCSFTKDSRTVTLAHLYPRMENVSARSAIYATPGTSERSEPLISWTVPLDIGADTKASFPWIDARLQAGETVVFSNPADLPAEADQDKHALGVVGLQSAVVIPFRLEGLVAGAVSFVRTREEGQWSRQMVENLKLVTHVLCHGIALKLQEEELKEALTEARQFKSALDAHANVSITDAQGKIWYVNDNFCAILKYAPEEVQGQDHRIINSGHHPKEFFADLWATIERGAVWRGEIRNRAKDGSLCWMSTTIVPIVNEQGKPRDYISIRFDITERKLAEEALAASYGEIKQLKERLQAETDYLKTEIKVTQAHGEIIGRSRVIKRVLHQVEQVAPVDCTVLITGETGTGKELIARAIHRLSPRRERIMVAVNCAALPSSLVDSELFGRERGAYTGALTSEVGRFEFADGSTIFLDEIGELSLEVQAKLLRILQSGEFQRLGNPKTRKVNVRVLAATNKDLATEVREGRFREDLFYRLQVFPIDVPPLRERVEDLPLLVSAFVEEFSSRMSKQINRISRNMIEALERHSWPGNIRELRNVIERGVILSSGNSLTVANLTQSSEAVAPPSSLAEVERDHILKTLQGANWRVKGPYGAAKRLQINPSTLYSRMAKLDIHRGRLEDGVPTQGQ